jgi:hypothetical protein
MEEKIEREIERELREIDNNRWKSKRKIDGVRRENRQRIEKLEAAEENH